MMVTLTVKRSLAAAGAAALFTTLAGCSLLGASPDPTATSAANDALAAKFVACLTEQDQTAKIVDGGMVGLLLPEGADDAGGMMMGSPADEGGGSSEPTMVMMMMDDDGAWQISNTAAGYPEEGGMREAWAACELEVPDFEQPEPDLSGAESAGLSMEDQLEASLAFADCARENGYADFADPTEYGELDIPSMSEDEFRALLDACADTLEDVGLPMTQESIERFDFDWMAVMDEYFTGGMTGVRPVEPTP
jgi:hypothetical protein